MDWILLATNIATGAAVGYITNTLAIRMLFREYPIIGGGEVIKSRDALEQSMSKLVEEQLITPDTLLEEFEKPAFKRSFEQLIHSILSDHLKQQIQQFDTPAELKGYSRTLSNLKRFLKSHRQHVLSACLNALFDHVQVQDVVSEAQQTRIFNAIWDRLLHTLERHHVGLGENLNETLSALKLQDLFSRDMVASLLHQSLEGIDKAFLAADGFTQAEQLATTLQLDELLNRLEAQLRQRSLSEILGALSESAPAQQIVQRLLAFLDTDRGQHLVAELLQQGVSVLKKLDLPLGLLLNETLEARIAELLQRYLPTALVSLKRWAENNREALEALIQEAIQEHLRSESLVKHMTATLFNDQISSRYQIVENILAEIENIANQSQPELIEMIYRFVENTSIGHVATYLEAHVLDYQALTHTLMRLLKAYLPRLDLSLLDPLLQRRLDSFSVLKPLHLLPLWQQVLYPYVKSQLIQRVLPQVSDRLVELVLEIWDGYADRLFSDWLHQEQMETWIQRLLKWLKNSDLQQVIQEKMKQHLPDILSNRSLQTLITPGVKEALWNTLGRLYEQRLDVFLDAFEKENMESLYDQLVQVFFKLTEQEEVAFTAREVLVGFMVDLLRENRLLDTRIYQTVKESFSRLSDDEMRQEMEDFMGAELQPITVLGAVLGAGVGGLLSLLSAPLPVLTTGYPALAFFPLTYALTGIGTNWLAIRMLFRPYYARYGLFLKRKPRSEKSSPMPFTPGVFVKNKAALADSMARFIDQKLLSKQNMVDILERYHHHWRRVMKTVVSQNDYAAWDTRFREATRQSYDLLTPLLLDMGFEQLYHLRQEVSASLVKEAREVELAPEDLDALQHEMEQVLLESQSLLERTLKRVLDQALHQPYALEEQLGPDGVSSAQDVLHGLLRVLFQQGQAAIADPAQVQQVIQQLSQRWEGYLSLQLATFTPGETFSKQGLVRYLLNWIQGDPLQEELYKLLQRALSHMLDSGQTLGELWNGQLLGLVRQESDTLIDIVSVYLLELASRNKERMAKAVSKDVQRQGFLEVMMVNFGGVRQDVQKVVNVVVDQKLEPFLAERATGLKAWWQERLNHEVPALALSDLGLSTDLFEVRVMQRILRDNVLTNPYVFELLTTLTDHMIDELLEQLDMKALLQSLNLYSLEDLADRFSPEMDYTRQHFERQLQRQQSTVLAQLEQCADFVLDYQVLSRPLRIEESNVFALKQSLHATLRELYRSPALEHLVPHISSEVFAPLRRGDIAQFLDYAALEIDTQHTIETLTLANTERSQAFRKAIRENLKPLAVGFVDVLNENIASDTKVELENLAIDSLIDGLRINNRELLEPVDFEAIVRRQVIAMNPRRIEALFDFAQPVFRALILYGALGGVIGVVAGLMAAF